MIRHKPSSRPKATPEKQGEVFLAAHNAETPGTAVQADDPRIAASGVTDHGALTGLADDDHTQYQLRTEKASASGYASLDASTLVPVAQLPAATTTANGVSELATSGENAASVVVQGNDARINVVTTKGDIYSASGANTGARQGVGSDGQVLEALASETTGLKWRTHNTAKGDLLGHNGTNHVRVPVGTDGKILTATSSDAEGVDWAYASAFPGDVCFSLGADGSLTLVGATVRGDEALNIPCDYYTTLDIVTFSYSSTASDERWRIYCSVLLTGNGGEISVAPHGGGTVAGGAGAGGGGAGGASGLCGGILQVYAKEISGSGTISANGNTASNGANATVASATANGANGSTGVNTCTFRNILIAGGSATVGNGGVSTGAGGAGGSGNSPSASGSLALMRQPQGWIVESEFGNTVTTTPWDTTPGAPDGAGAGGRNTGAQGAGGGGSAGGAIGYFGVNPAGSSGCTGVAGAAGAGGGAGGAGGSGGILTVVSRKCTATWTFRSNGGNGGDGGNGFGNGGGGAGGPGGCGGWTKVCLGYLSDAPTVQSNGGNGGNKGTGGTGGANGNPGGAGLAEPYVF